MATEAPSSGEEAMSGNKYAASTTTVSVSSLYSMLPNIVQRQFPPFASLRRTANTYAAPRAPAHTHRQTASDLSSTGCATPPPSYHEQEVLQPFIAHFAFPNSRPSSSGSVSPLYPAEEVESGIQWNYAQQGMSMMSQAHQDLTAETGDRQFSRRLYIDGVSYSLRGVPGNLSPEELSSLRDALPSSLLASTSPETSYTQTYPRASTTDPPAASRPQQAHSLLHTLASRTTTALCLLLAIILPYIRAWVNTAYRFERRHKVSDRMLATGYITAETLGRRTVNLANQLLTMNDGKVRAFFVALFIYCMREASHGTREGLGVGMEQLGFVEFDGGAGWRERERERGRIREERED